MAPPSRHLREAPFDLVSGMISCEASRYSLLLDRGGYVAAPTLDSNQQKKGSFIKPTDKGIVRDGHSFQIRYYRIINEKSWGS